MSQPTTVILRARNAHARKRVVSLVAILLVTCGVQLGSAADESNDGRPVGFPQYLMLVSSPPVQADIQLSDEQKEEIAGLAQNHMQSAYEFHAHMLEMMDLPGFSPQDRLKVSEDMRRKQAELAGEIDKKALAILDQSQHRRLAQLRLRVMGAAILLDPKLREQLRVSDTQLKQLKEAFLERNKACQEYLAEARRKNARHDEMKAKIDEIRGQAWTGMLRTFTATQKRILRELLGPKPAFKPNEVKLRLSMKVR